MRYQDMKLRDAAKMAIVGAVIAVVIPRDQCLLISATYASKPLSAKVIGFI